MAQDILYPFGLDDVSLYLITSGSYGTAVDLPASRVFSYTPDIATENLEGDDQIVASHSQDRGGTWDLESGGIPIAGWEVLTGATASDSGTTPNEVTYMDITTSLSRPYFGVIGRAISDEGGDTHVQIWKAKCTDGPSGSFSGGSFHLVSASGVYVPDSSGNIIRLMNHETKVAIPSTWPTEPYTSS